MNLDQVTAELRPRGSWEAIDLGARLTRRDWKTVYTVWLTIMLPLVLAFCLLMLYFPSGIWVGLAYWWLEPLADGPVLHVLSRRLFGANVTARDALRQTLPLLRRNWIFLLPLYRFHLSRSLAMPVTQLEGLSGKQRRKRMAVINRSAANHGVGLTTIYHHLFIALYLGMMALVYLLIPTEWQQDISGELLTFIESNSASANIVSLLMVFVVQALLQPWFIGGGFGLYVNRRTHLEGWDIEIAFRRMNARHTISGNGRPLATALCLLLLASASWPTQAIAQNKQNEQKAHDKQDTSDMIDVEQPPQLQSFVTREQARAAVDEAFADSRFGKTRIVTEWQRIETDARDDEPTDTSAQDFGTLTAILAFIAEFALWIIAAIGIVLLLAMARTIFQRTPLSRVTTEPPQFHRQQQDTLAAVEPLPDDIPAAVLALWTSSPREALALLYRASLEHLATTRELTFSDGATETECLSIVTNHLNGPVVPHFSGIVRLWQKLAYADEVPAQNTVEALVADWESLYGGVA